MGITFQKDGIGSLITDVKPEVGPAAKAGVKERRNLAAEATSMKDAETSDFVKMVGAMRPGTVIALK